MKSQYLTHIRVTMIIKALFLLTTLLKLISANCAYQGVATAYQSNNNYQNYQTCKKEKVVNKVPVHELCEWEKIQWKFFTFRNDDSFCNLHGVEGNYDKKLSIPRKFQVYKRRVFFSIERQKRVYSTLNYFYLDDIVDKKCPEALCYPNCAVNTFASPQCSISSVYLTNVKDFEIDKCGVLWALDVGYYCKDSIVNPKFVQKPRLCLFNTSTDEFVKCYDLPNDVYYKDDVLGYNTLLVNTNCGCDKAFVYLFNARSGMLVVFSLERESFSAFRSIWLNPDPVFTRFDLTLSDYMNHEYVVEDGVAAVLGDYGVTFSPRPSDKLYFAPYKFLHEPTNADLDELDYDISELGSLNEDGQTSTLVRFNDTVFGVQELKHSIVCYNRRADINPDAFQFLVQDRDEYSFIADLSLNVEHIRSPMLYFLTNNLIDIKCNGFDNSKSNFQFFYIDVKEALRLYPECKGYYKDLYQQVYRSKQKSSGYQRSAVRAQVQGVMDPYYATRK